MGTRGIFMVARAWRASSSMVVVGSLTRWTVGGYIKDGVERGETSGSGCERLNVGNTES